MQFKIDIVNVGTDSNSWSYRQMFDNLPESYKQELNIGKQLGRGVYGTVYASKRTRVVKVCDGKSAYAEYVRELSKMKKPNPHFPVIYWAKMFCFKNGDKLLVVEMERLKELGRAKFGDCWANLFPQNEMAHVVHFFDWTSNVEKYWVLTGHNELHNAREFLGKTFKKLSNKRDYIRKDMHSGNVMLRKDGTPVVTDPYAG